MDPVQFDELPYLCLKKIFSFLNLRDLTTCRAVSRQFKEYADEARVDELVVDGCECESPYCHLHCKTWYQTDRAIDRGCSISARAFASLKSSLESSPFKLDQQLKFLHLHLLYPSDISLEILNEFKQLRHLELRGVGGPSTLILPNLKVLDVRLCWRASFVLKTPKLEVLACSDISSIQAEHPETIKRLEWDYQRDNLTGLTSFENLQIFVCHCSRPDLDGIRLSNWKDLREMRILPSFHYWREESGTFEAFQSSLANLMRQRTESKREDPKLYLDEVLLIDGKQLEDYSAVFDVEDLTDQFRTKYYRLLRCDTYPHLTFVKFNWLTNVELSSDFFDRFPRIQTLIARSPVDRDRFEWFLQNATAVRELILNNTSLDSAFMNRLPQMNSRLTSLEVYESPDLTADLDFVLQFKQLKRFETDCEFDSLDFAAKAFRRLNELQSFHFKARNKLVQIGRDSLRNDYYLRITSWISGAQMIYRENLDWAQLVALYDEGRAAATPPMSDDDMSEEEMSDEDDFY